MTAKQMVNKNTCITLIELILIIFSQRHSQYYIFVNLFKFLPERYALLDAEINTTSLTHPCQKQSHCDLLPALLQNDNLLYSYIQYIYLCIYKMK